MEILPPSYRNRKAISRRVLNVFVFLWRNNFFKRNAVKPRITTFLSQIYTYIVQKQMIWALVEICVGNWQLILFCLKNCCRNASHSCQLVASIFNHATNIRNWNCLPIPTTDNTTFSHQNHHKDRDRMISFYSSSIVYISPSILSSIFVILEFNNFKGSLDSRFYKVQSPEYHI